MVDSTKKKDDQLNQMTYQPSGNVQQAQNAVQQQQAAKPAQYQSQYQEQLKGISDKILNRPKFNYDINSDALYQQYANQYANMGKMAMMDTMGQAQALTGGYGNSYAQTVGQQAYQGYMQQLNDKIPELYQLALNQYMMEGDELYGQQAMLSAQENQEYGRYRDTVSDWSTELARLQSLYENERNFDYGQYTDQRAYDYQAGRDAVADKQWQTQFDEARRQYEQNFGYQQNRDQVADSQWQQSFDYQQNRDQVSDAQWQQQFNEALRQYEQNFGYQQNRDQVADRQWQQQYEQALREWFTNMEYQKSRDEVADQQWQDSFQYQQDRDAVSDKQWQQSMEYQQGRDQVADEQWQKEYEEMLRQFNFANSLGEFAPKTPTYVVTGGGGSGGVNGGNNDSGIGTQAGKTDLTPLLDSIVDNAAGTRYENSQAVSTMINKEIEAAKNAGEITQQQANQLKNQYGTNVVVKKPSTSANRYTK